METEADMIQGAQMARRGRKRSPAAERYPGGGIVPQDETPVGELARARRAYLRELRNPLFENELGFLYLAKEIEAEQRLAGESFAKLVNKYRLVVLDGPNGRPKISQLQPRMASHDSKEFDVGLMKAIQDQYDGAYAVVEETHGIRTMAAVYKLSVDNHCLPWFELRLAKMGLNTLAKYFGIENR